MFDKFQFIVAESSNESGVTQWCIGHHCAKGSHCPAALAAKFQFVELIFYVFKTRCTALRCEQEWKPDRIAVWLSLFCERPVKRTAVPRPYSFLKNALMALAEAETLPC